MIIGNYSKEEFLKTKALKGKLKPEWGRYSLIWDVEVYVALNDIGFQSFWS